ncbi:hypothetical protein FRZ67_01355 [Panacibacter ginsenosidivorans]|uniref:DUF4595 domain-containing protein n=1 Tax=Panacibacter ginsenosidivorans TaxID=1813871 RepID=A0A5B8V4R2_9BACT|nr:hypothetical protein [Panacibacter ginsenosidivorans]QEC66015.1 hypothetical protein FRZ67_01355 [Panacibacter ginsenosidivorans]
MKYSSYIIITLLVFAGSCKNKDIAGPTPLPVGEPVDTQTVLLKDMIIRNLPSPYYHFEYDDSAFITTVNYQSSAGVYTLSYLNGRIIQIQNNTAVNKERLQYVYENGKVIKINYINEAGIIFKESIFSYNDSKQLIKVAWNIIETSSRIIPERTLQLEYYTDGNLSKLIDHRIEIPDKQAESFYIDTYENYDSNTNADDFSLLHKSGDHLILLPGIVLQKNNPCKETRTGDGINYAITYRYTYQNKLPVKKDGDMVFLNGDNIGMHNNYNISFSYY